MSTLTRYLAVCHRLKEIRSTRNKDYNEPIAGHKAEWKRLVKEQKELHLRLFGRPLNSKSDCTQKKLKELSRKTTAIPTERYGLGSIPIYD